MDKDCSPRTAESYLLKVSDLSIGIKRSDHVLQLTDRVSFTIKAGEIHGLIGESGCGKSISSLAVMGMLPEPGGTLMSGSVQFGGEDIYSLDGASLNSLKHPSR